MVNPFINTVTSWFLKKRIHQIELFLKYPNEVQNELLLKLLNTAKNTSIGKLYDFNSIKSYNEFSERVPVTTYEEISEIIDDDGTKVKVITGEFWGKKGPVDGIAADPLYLDINIPAGLRKSFKVDTYRNTFAYIFEGAGKFADASIPKGILLEKEVLGQEVNIRDMSGNRTLVQFGTGDEIVVQAGSKGIRFLLVAGTPIKEPVAWHGPNVMNTREELQTAFNDLRNDRFIKPFGH